MQVDILAIVPKIKKHESITKIKVKIIIARTWVVLKLFSTSSKWSAMFVRVVRGAVGFVLFNHSVFLFVRIVESRISSNNLVCFLEPVIIPWLAQGSRMLLFEWLARGQADASPFQREKLETAEEENRKAAKTMQGKHICCISATFILISVSDLLKLLSLFC